MEIDLDRIQAMFDYHVAAASEPNPHADGIVVFGRYDLRVPHLAADLYHAGYGRYVVPSGAIGKDSGALTEWGVAEANYLAIAMNSFYGLPMEAIYPETEALNGGQNAELSLRLIRNLDLPRTALNVVIHATS